MGLPFAVAIICTCLPRKSRISPAISSPFGFQGEVAGVEQVKLQRLEVALVRLGPGGRENLVVLAPRDQHRRLVLAKILLPLGYSGGLLP